MYIKKYLIELEYLLLGSIIFSNGIFLSFTRLMRAAFLCNLIRFIFLNVNLHFCNAFQDAFLHHYI